MAKQNAALCIVNTRKAARDLFRILREKGCADALHLSKTMCPAHRLEVIDEIRKRLHEKRACRLVSTQLIECGCDVDFPLVLREMAPLEAIIQSAGRCNREGLLKTTDGRPAGRVIVFRSQESSLPPDRWYRLGRDKVEQDFLAMNRHPNIGKPEDIEEYFHRLYRSGDLDQHEIQTDREALRFAQVALNYRLIDDETVPVIVAIWESRQAEIEELMKQLRRNPNKSLFRQLSKFQVNLRQYELCNAGGSVVSDASGVKVWLGPYDRCLGLSPTNIDAVLIV
jgi:CRISPR-associated endonuclease/helicase Cas3